MWVMFCTHKLIRSYYSQIYLNLSPSRKQLGFKIFMWCDILICLSRGSVHDLRLQDFNHFYL